jgi:hypothetical protein
VTQDMIQRVDLQAYVLYWVVMSDDRTCCLSVCQTSPPPDSVHWRALHPMHPE